MKDKDKTKEQLIKELVELRQRVAEIESIKTDCKCAEEALREKEKRYKLATSAGQVGVWDWNININEIYLDPILKAMLGYADHEIQNHTDDWVKLMHPDDTERVMAEVKAYLEGLTPLYEIPHRMLHKDGSIRWFLARGIAIRDANGKPYRMLGTDTDITDRKLAMEALLESKEKYRLVVENAHDGIVVIQDGMLRFANRGASYFSGYSIDELTSRPFMEFVYPDDRKMAMAYHLRRLKDEKVPEIYVLRVIDKNGKIRWIETGGVTITWEGRPATLNFLRDITERKRAEDELRKHRYHLEELVKERTAELKEANRQLERELTERKQTEQALQESEERYRHLVELSPDGICIHAEGKVVFANTAGVKLMGATNAEELIGKQILDIVHPDYREIVKKRVLQVLEKRTRAPFIEEKFIRLNGTILDVEVAAIPFNYKGKPAVQIVARDIIDRKRAEEALRESEKRFRDLFDDAPIGYHELDIEGRIIQVNRTELDMLGYTEEEMLGRHVWEFIVESEKSQQTFKAKKAGVMPPDKAYERTFRRKGGTEVPVLVENRLLKNEEGRFVGIRTTIQDVTRRKKAEELFYKAFHASPLSINITHLKDGRFIDVNESFLKNFGYSRDEVIDHTSLELNIWGNHAECDLFKKAVMEKKNIRNMEINLYTKSGDKRCFHYSAELIDIGSELCLLCIGQDITERKQAEKKIINYQKQLQSLASELSLAEERERRRLALVLHEGIGQVLATAKIKLGVLGEFASSTELVRPLQEIREMIDQSIQDTRSLTLELSPPVLYELGFETAIEWLAEHIQKQYGIPTKFENDREPKPLSDDIQVILFQATRELLLNVVKHSQASSAKVTIQKDNLDIRVIVEDNGVGFNITEAGSHLSKTGGFGLFSIHERLKHFGGHCEIESESGRGTKVILAAQLRRNVKTLKKKRSSP